ncbi:MAG: polymer-forming cytoskeletal protein [Thermodesulfobacteriota bacterium]
MFGKGSRALETIVGDGTLVAGRLTVKGTVRVDGTVEGDIQADWVVVGEPGKVRGNIAARGILVGGSVEGNLHAAETVELAAKSSTAGEILTPKLTIAEGAVFEGHARMKGDAVTVSADA